MKRVDNRGTVFPGSGHQSGTAAEEAAGGRTRTAQEKKPGFWNGYVILELGVWVLCRYEVTSKDELLQEIYLEEEKALLIISI